MATGDTAYRTYRSYIRERFGKPVLKVPINGGFSCPNRDGTIGVSGCTFCDNRAFSPVADSHAPAIEQLQRAIAKAAHRFDLFMPYLQPYSNTYGPVSKLRSVYEPLVAHPKTAGLAVGTRPDCFCDETFEYLHDVARRIYLSVELGLQSADDEVLRMCRRGHTYGDFERSAKRLAVSGIEVVAHVMIGLPGDSPESVCLTAERLASLPVHGVKLHQLMVVEGTEIARWYREGKVQELGLERYAELVGMFLARLRPDQCIHRLVADTRTEKGLLAPSWSADKSRTISYIHGYLAKSGIFQGALFSPA